MSLSTIIISAVNYTAYASVAEADPYLAVDPVRAVTWDALTEDQKGMFLIAATRRLDLLDWLGEKTGGSSQENKWPRTDVTYPDGTDVSTSEVPQEVENATIILAGSIALTDTFADAGTSGSNKKRIKAGSAEIEFFRPTVGVPLQVETAYQLIDIFLSGSAATTAALGALASGCDEETSFTDSNLGFGLSKGYP